MAAYKKWLGGGVGWMIGGPMGGLLGFAFGSLLDSATVEVIRHEINSDGTSTPESDFRVSLLLLSAIVMKADGQATREETEYVRNFFVRKFGAEKAAASMRVFNRLNKGNIAMEDVCRQVRRLTDYHSRLQLVHYLFGVAQADGHLTEGELRVLAKIASLLGLHPTEFSSIHGMFYKQNGVASAYLILGVAKTDTNEAIKTAYRKLTLKYHPDKVGHLGEHVQREAKEKFQKVVEAYEIIKKERRMV
ncbi:MAG TPA: TerB family tellurite resistance protein [Chitinophagales bacterium]|nr:TerB family tellurite resistance protein [Chitinophagales bacterium]